ncbi:autotransporter outer membrane beta-barrel domain-containing protein [Luteibacter pinisoli]|nr:autotransporter outer membrane beta-barrel domain-containing protein [Luteibacter pinisoli]
MRTSRPLFARRAALCHAIALALAVPAFSTHARVLNPGEQYTVRAGDPVQNWVVTGNGMLTLNPGASTLGIALTTSTLDATDASIRTTGGTRFDLALSVANGSVATIQGGEIRSEMGIGLAVTGQGGSEGDDRPSSASVTGAAISGGNRGASVGNGGTLTTSNAQITGTGSAGVGIEVDSGTATLQNGTLVSGGTNGAMLFGDSHGGSVPDPGRFLIVDGSTVQGLTGAAVAVRYGIPTDTNASISVVNGGALIGGNGVAIDVGPRMHADVGVANSSVVGNITAANLASASVNLGSKGVLVGQVSGQGSVTMGIDATGGWQLTGDSTVAALRLDGEASFAKAGDYKALNVSGDFTGTGGRMTFNTLLNAGGTEGQFTDRLLVHGNVDAGSKTIISVVPTGEGALTDTNRDGRVDNNEGISLIQVAGSSHENAFVLAGGYVAAGPWQYTLHGFGPGQVDPSQSELGGGDFQWDYRLGNRYVSDCGDDCHPVDPVDPVDPVNPVDPVTPVDPADPVLPGEPGPVDRVAVVPQLPSYMLAPMALQNYGNTLSDGLHQRLGEIRDSAYGVDVGGEVFARAIGSQLNYSRNLSFQRYGYDFDQQINALQVGGGIVAVDDDQGSIRAGWALDHGTTRVTPSAADGNSHAKYYANGGSIWVTYQHGSGLWVDGVLGVRRFQGDVSTDLRGGDVGRLRAQGWTMSVEVGKPLPLGGDWTVEPQFQFRAQQLNFRDFRDKDGLDIRLGNSVQTTSRLGIQVGRTANPVLAPYGRLDLIHTSNGNPTLSASSEAWNTGDTFQTGNTGNAYRVAAGATSQLTDHVQLYGEGTWQHYVGNYGLKGWSANVGVRVTF